MRKKDELKIDVLSGIDDKFIDKVSAKRYSLLNRKKMPKWIISSAAAAILVAIMIPVLLTLLVKQVPIYEGMTVLENYNGTSSVSIEPERRGNGFDFLSDTRDNNGNGNNGDNGNHNGHNKKPVDEIIEEDSSISLEIPDQKMYYAKPDQDIYINVHISNPDSFEILSFTLNGKKYSSYMFEDGSDMENLILKVNVGDAKGVIEYTIDAIKYVDGTEIKDVIMEGDRTIKVGVYSAGIQPKISASNEFIGINEVSLEVDLSDKFELIERCGGKAYAFICNDEKLLESKTVDLGYNKIEFKNLKTNTTYTYGVFAYYDALDGKGMEKHILFEKEFTTKTVVAVKDPEIAQESISFNVVFNELFKSKKLSAMTLYLGEAKVAEVNVSGDITKKTFTLTKLLSNNEYRLVLKYENLGKTETVEYTFKTLEKAPPDFTLTETEKTQTSFKFDITVTDVDSVGAISKIELVHGDDVTNIENLATRELAELLSNNDYTIKVTYTYDLNDGVGKQTLIKELTIKTEEKAEPTFTIKDVTSDTYTISGSYEKTNTDNTLISYSVTLYKGDELISESAEKKIDFSSLDYYTDYTVKITYTFDANDGKGVQEKVSQHEIKTAPYIDVNNIIVRNTTAVSEGETIYIQINVVNPCKTKITDVVINGNRYSVSSASNTETVFIEVVCDESLGGGEVTLVIEAIRVNIDEASYDILVEGEKSTNLFINGVFEFVSVEFVNEQYEPKYWHFEGEKLFVKITVNNPTEYEIREIEMSGSSFAHHGSTFTDTITNESLIRISDNEYVIDFADNGWDRTINQVSIRYGNQYISKSLSVEDLFVQCVYMDSNEKIYISNAQELLSLQYTDLERRYFELTADIDLFGVKWNPCQFNGVLNANGHSIKNLSLLGSDYSSYGIGVFTGLSGIIYNLTLENIFVMINNLKDDYPIGMIVSGYNSGSIVNCSIDESSVINIDGGNVGAITGYNQGVIINCINNASISGLEIGGITYMNEGEIYNCVNNGEIIADWRGSGISSYNHHGFIHDCENNGTIRGTVANGITCEDNGTIAHCKNNGTIFSNETVQ